MDEFKLRSELLERAAKVVNAFESEQVQVRVIDFLIETLREPAASAQ